MSSINSNPFGLVAATTPIPPPPAPAIQWSGQTSTAGYVGVPGPMGQPTWGPDYYGSQAFPQHPPVHTFSIMNTKGQLILMIDQAGEIVFGAGASEWNDTAREFWKTMVCANPLSFEVSVLKCHRRELVLTVLQLNKQITDLQEENVKLREKLRNGQT